MLEPQHPAGAQLLGAGQPVFGHNGFLAQAVLLGHIKHRFAGLHDVVLHGCLVALAFEVVRPAHHDRIETRQLVVMQELAQPLVAAPGQVGGGFAGQGNEGPQVVHAHFGGVGGHGGGAQQLAPALQALVGHNASGLGDIAHRHDERVGAVGGYGGGQQPVVVGTQRGRIDVQRQRLGIERLPRHGRKLLQTQRRAGVLAAGGLEGQLLGQKHQHVGRRGFGDGNFGGIGIGG